MFPDFQTWIGFFSTFFEQNQKTRKLRKFFWSWSFSVLSFSEIGDKKILHSFIHSSSFIPRTGRVSLGRFRIRHSKPCFLSFFSLSFFHFFSFLPFLFLFSFLFFFVFFFFFNLDFLSFFLFFLSFFLFFLFLFSSLYFLFYFCFLYFFLSIFLSFFLCFLFLFLFFFLGDVTKEFPYKLIWPLCGTTYLYL